MDRHSLDFPAGLTLLALLALLGLGACRASSAPPHKARRTHALSTPAWRNQLTVAQTPTRSQPRSGFDDERLWSREDDWEPALAADPVRPNVYQLTTRYNPRGGGPGSPDPAIGFRRSIDGGASFGPDSFLDGVADGQNDPEIAVAQDGTLFAAWLEGYVPGVRFARSTDQGVTWTSPLAVAQGAGPPSWSDKPVLAAGADGLDVFIAFNASDSWIVASHDGGQTFGPPVRTNNDSRYWFHSAGVVAPNGDVLFCATDFSQTYAGTSNVNVIRSFDGGASWITDRVDSSAELPDCPWAPGCTFGFLGPSAALAVDNAGSYVLAYNAGDNPGGAQRLWARYSADGISWSTRTELSRAAPGSNHAFARLASGPQTGEFYVLWQDDRNGTGFWNTWLRRSRDGGQTWTSEVLLSNLGQGAPYKSALGYSFPYGDYAALDVGADGQVHAAWGEGSSWNGPGGIWFTRGR